MRPGFGTTLALWLRERRGVLGLLLATEGVLFAVYALYGVEWMIPLYTGEVILAVFGVAGAVDLGRFAARHRALRDIAGRFPTAPLPVPRTPLAADAAAVIEALEAERARLQAALAARQRDSDDYYTLWAHQIKTPIAAMRLLLQQQGGELPRPQRAALEAELLRVEQYVGMVLQYQRLHSLHADLEFETQQLDALVRRAAKGLAPLFILKKLPLEIGALPGSVVTDAKWMGFVLEQLLTNALKYTREGCVRVYAEDSRLVVEDTGIGIRPEDLPRVFERGFTGHTGREDAHSTGIGLYLCREILGRLGFSLRLESTLGSGTRAILDISQTTAELD